MAMIARSSGRVAPKLMLVGRGRGVATRAGRAGRGDHQWKPAATVGAAAALGYFAYDAWRRPLLAEKVAAKAVARDSAEFIEPPVRKELPTFRLADVKKHNSAKTGVWVTYRGGVYDITQFISQHPGGPDRIKLASGASIEPFWHLYPQHKTATTLEILETNRIGNLDPKDIDTKQEYLKNDPYKDDPVRHPGMTPNSLKPYCAEAIPAMLTDNFYTPNELHYVRNHHPVPVVDPAKYRLQVSIDGKRGNKSLTLNDLKTKFKPKEVSCALQCAGNRRIHFNPIRMTSLAQYDVSAISCAKWEGAPLRDVLLSAGMPEDYEKEGIQFIIFEVPPAVGQPVGQCSFGQALDLDPGSGKPFKVSIPVQKAMDPLGECIVCYKMNGEDLPGDHGYPCRVLNPGFVGFRNCKWVTKIRASKTENPPEDGPWQHNFYKVTPPRPDIPSFDFTKIPQIYIWPVQSIICDPMENGTVEEGTDELLVKGVAWSGLGRGIQRVDVTVDDGKTWETAELNSLDQPWGRRWAWTHWQAEMKLKKPLKKGQKLRIRCKAVDDAYNSQPQEITDIWNLRGCFNNSQHFVDLETTD